MNKVFVINNLDTKMLVVVLYKADNENIRNKNNINRKVRELNRK